MRIRSLLLWIFTFLPISPVVADNRHEWPQYRGNAGFTGVSADDSVKPPLKLLWSYRLDGDASGDAGAGVVVAGGKVFTPVHNTKSLVTLDADTGRFLWEYRDNANSCHSVPTYHEGRVFLWQRGRTKEHFVVALDAANGKELWRHAMRGEHADIKRVGLPIWQGKLYCSEGGDPPSVFALEARTGEVVWKTPLTKEHGSYAIAPTVAGGHVFMATCNGMGFRQATTGAVFALDATTGKEQWCRPGLYPNRTLTTDGKVVVYAMFAKTITNAFLLNAKSGETMWTSPAQFHYNPATITDDLVLIRPYGATCLGLERDSGKKRWNFDIPKSNSGCCSPAVSGKYAYYGVGVTGPGDLESLASFQLVHAPREQGVTGTMVALDLATGKSVWRFSTGNCICGDPALAYGRLYFTSRDGCVYCFVPAKESESTLPDAVDRTPNLPRAAVEKIFRAHRDADARSGKDWIMQGGTPARAGAEASLAAALEPAWSADTGGAIVNSAAIRNGRVYVGSDSGKIFAFDLKTGAKQWEFATGGKVRCSPAVADDAVYCGSDDGHLYSLFPGNGKVQWKYQAGGPIQASPMIVGGLLVVGANDHHVYAVDRLTGKKAWSAKLNDYKIVAPPLLADDLVIAGQWNDWVWGLDLFTGEAKWKTFIPVTIESLSLHQNKIYARNPNYVVELDPTNGRRLRLSSASWGWGGLAFVGNQMFVSGIQSQYGTHGATVTQLDEPGTSLKKTIPTMEDVRLLKPKAIKGSSDLASMSTPLALGDKLCFAAVSGKITLTSLDGTRLGSHQLGGTCHAPPIAADGHLVVGCDDGKLYAFRELGK